MNSEDIKAVDTILLAIKSYVDEMILKAPFTTMFQSVVWEKNGDLYIVTKNKNKYTVKNGLGTRLNIGQAVWVCVPNGKLKDMFICAIR